MADTWFASYAARSCFIHTFLHIQPYLHSPMSYANREISNQLIPLLVNGYELKFSW